MRSNAQLLNPKIRSKPPLEGISALWYAYMFGHSAQLINTRPDFVGVSSTEDDHGG